MCPLRVILLFLSAMLAGYFAIKTVRAQGESSVVELREEEPEKAIEQTGLFSKVSTGVCSSFWMMVDMFSGRYLYQNLKGQAKGEAVSKEN